MGKLNIGIIGNGFVGQAIAFGFSPVARVRIYDVDPIRCVDSFDETVNRSDILYVSVPTPMNSDGTINLDIVNNVCENIMEARTRKDNVIVLKSTMIPGTTDKLAEKFPSLDFVYNPEFLTARNAIQDFANSERNIVGGDPELCYDFVRFFEQCFPNIPSIVTSSDESETIKYFSNTFLAYKVAYFNKLYDMCQAIGMDYDVVCEGVTADSRIGKSHTQVPGIDNDRGFGGTCFPKDLNSLIVQMESHGVNADMLKEVWKYNEQIRKVIDWPVT